MWHLSILAAFALMLASLGCSAAPSQPDPLGQYRKYVAAVRAGDVGEIQKVSVAVSDSVKPIQLAWIKLYILMERLRSETTAQFGPIDLAKEGLWTGYGVPTDETLKTVRVEVHDDFADLKTNDPKTGRPDMTVAWLVRRNGSWRMPIGLEMDIDEQGGIKHSIAEPEDRKGMVEEIDKTAKAMQQVLKRLEKKEFKSAAEVMKSLHETMPAVEGEIDT